MQRAEFILALCDRWKKLPSEILAEPAEMIRLLRLENLENTEGGEPGGE